MPCRRRGALDDPFALTPPPSRETLYGRAGDRARRTSREAFPRRACRSTIADGASSVFTSACTETPGAAPGAPDPNPNASARTTSAASSPPVGRRERRERERSRLCSAARASARGSARAALFKQRGRASARTSALLEQRGRASASALFERCGRRAVRVSQLLRPYPGALFIAAPRRLSER